jgi:hypothetical protein
MEIECRETKEAYLSLICYHFECVEEEAEQAGK